MSSFSHPIQESKHVDDFATFFDMHPYLGQYKIIFKYYSKELLSQPRAANEWVEPDLCVLPTDTKSLV